MGDAKKMTETEKVENVVKEEARSVDFAELRDDLFREASKLVCENPSTRIAIFVTPPASESDVSMYSFAHPSVEGVVENFLKDKSPAPVTEAEEDEEDNDEDDEDEEEDSPSRFWWEDQKLFESMNPEQLNEAYHKLVRLRNNMRLQLDSLEKGQASGNQKDLPKP